MNTNLSIGMLLWMLNTIRLHTVFMYQKAFLLRLVQSYRKTGRVSSKLLSDINTSRGCITGNKSLPRTQRRPAERGRAEK